MPLFPFPTPFFPVKHAIPIRKCSGTSRMGPPPFSPIFSFSLSRSHNASSLLGQSKDNETEAHAPHRNQAQRGPSKAAKPCETGTPGHHAEPRTAPTLPRPVLANPAKQRTLPTISPGKQRYNPSPSFQTPHHHYGSSTACSHGGGHLRRPRGGALHLRGRREAAAQHMVRQHVNLARPGVLPHATRPRNGVEDHSSPNPPNRATVRRPNTIPGKPNPLQRFELRL